MPAEDELRTAFFRGVTDAFREELRAGVVRRQELLGLSNNQLADLLGVGKSSVSTTLNHGIDRLSTVVRLLLVLGIDDVADLRLRRMSSLVGFGWLAALRRFDPGADLGLEDVEFLREMLACEDWPRASQTPALAATLAARFAEAISARLGRQVPARSVASLAALADRWGEPLAHCLDAIPLHEGGQS
jgi:hypothetical protein